MGIRQLIDWPAESEDDPLIDRLRELIAEVDPVPERVESGARLAFRAAFAASGWRPDASTGPQVVELDLTLFKE